MTAWEIVATWLVRGLGLYLLAGLLFGLAFVVRGIERVDRGAAGATLGFRLIVLPGVVALWPLLLRRWLAGTGVPPLEENAHRRAAAKEAGR